MFFGIFRGGVAEVISKLGGFLREGWPTMQRFPQTSLKEDQLEERGKIWVGSMCKAYPIRIKKIEKILNLNGPIKEGDYAVGNCV